jgi:hypothetical protein
VSFDCDEVIDNEIAKHQMICGTIRRIEVAIVVSLRALTCIHSRLKGLKNQLGLTIQSAIIIRQIPTPFKELVRPTARITSNS